MNVFTEHSEVAVVMERSVAVVMALVIFPFAVVVDFSECFPSI